MTKSVGVVIGRFQVPSLSSGHRELLRHAAIRNEQLLILVGRSPALLNNHDPIPVPQIVWMLQDEYPLASISIVHDCRSDEEWSAQVDSKIEDAIPGANATIYAGRGGCLEHYKGKHKTEYFTPILISKTGTELRSEVKPVNHFLFREGLIYAQQRRIPLNYQAVDIICYQGSAKDWILLGRKKNDPPEHWRLPGGFVDPQDDNLEMAALRELHEECGFIEVGDVAYFDSYRINDWRQRASPDKIMTAVFSCQYLWGKTKAADDLDRCEWLHLRDNIKIVDEHQLILNEWRLKNVR